MRIAVVGGSRGTGAQFTELARAAGHDVVVVSRNVQGSAADPAVAAKVVADVDAVVITVGAAKGVRHQRALVTSTVVEAMQAAGVRRLVVQSSLGAGGSASQLPGFFGFITKVLLAGPLKDHDAQEDAVRASGLDWTIVRPTGLTDKPATGAWRALEPSQDGKLGGTITRADLAAFMFQALTDDATIGSAVGISN